MPKLMQYRTWPWLVQKAADMTVMIGVVTAGVLAFDQFANWQPIASKKFVSEAIAQYDQHLETTVITPLQTADVTASGDRFDMKKALSDLTVQSLSYQVLQMQLQLQQLREKDGDMSPAERSLAQLLEDQIQKDQTSVRYAQCTADNLGRLNPQPCSAP